MKKIITDDMILGYRDYTIDRKTKKDFPTIESAAEWLCSQTLGYAETTKEFYDFVEQEYGIENIIKIIFDPSSPFDYDSSFEAQDVRESFKSRNAYMHASDFTE